MSDSDIGGYSKALLKHFPASGKEPAHAYFSGHISNRLPANDPVVERTGYAAWRTQDRPRHMFGKPLWDVEFYEWLALHVKTDGRKYKVNIQTESVEYTDIHQHRLYTTRPGEWETVLIKWKDFVRTNHGVIVEPQSEMMTEKVRTIGVGLTDRLAGPFEFSISKIWATNGLTVDELQESGRRNPSVIPKGQMPLETGSKSSEQQQSGAQ